ncbi:hypothetical protein ACFLZM_05895 [Thermodesulfobacteriota bacterium]
MTTKTRITIEADFGIKGIEKTDIFIYQDDKLIDTRLDQDYEDIRETARQMRVQHADAEVNIRCVGEDCMGGLHTWSMDP